MSNDQLRQWDQAVVWHAFTQMAEYTPFIVDSAQGCLLKDIEGNEYLDAVSSLWCNVHGHQHPQLNQAIQDQLNKVAHVTSLGASNTTTIRLAKRITEIAPEGLEHVFFSSDGASAVEVALKMAFQYWRQKTPVENHRTKYIAMSNAYHGDTLGCVSVSGVARFHEMFEPLLFDVLRLPIPDTYRTPPGVEADELKNYYLSFLEETLQQHHREIAALVIEPLVQCAAGLVIHPPGFLKGVRDLTKKYGVLMIADEVAVGMGKTGTLFACEQENVEPDFLCLGKGLTGGYLPMSATLTTTEIWNAFLGTREESKSFFHGHTFGGNPLCSAAALATLEIFEEEKTLEHLTEKIGRLGKHLEQISKNEHVGDVRQRGLIGAIELVRNRETKEPFSWEENRCESICQFAMSNGVWLRPLGNILVVMPPLSITTVELDKICRVIDEGIRVTTDQFTTSSPS